MPTYACYSAESRLSQDQKARIAEAITAAHSEEMAGPRYLVQVVFQHFGAGQEFIAAQPVSERQIWVRGDVRSGRRGPHRSALQFRSRARSVGSRRARPMTCGCTSPNFFR
jgi:phenylpyruvate tautomerase PptA (4-oxalocrotonate tautomerase family)